VKSADPGRGRRGFTLVELLVALVITGLLASVIFQMMSGQSRIVAVQSAKEEVQQNVRGSLEVISSELRGAVPQAITAADDQSLTYMQPRIWGILCIPVSTSEFVMLLPDASATLPAAGVGTGVLVNTNTTGGTNWVPAPPAQALVNQITNLGTAVPADCNNTGFSGSLQAVRVTTSVAIAGMAAGQTVGLYSILQYDVGQVDGEWWLRRSNGMVNGVPDPQPLAGPVEPDNVGFTYLDAAGNELATPVATPSSIRMVRVQVVSNSTQKLDDRVQRDSGAVTVTLRNAN
jgi:prepilin-type N-terminal cleavage/methylation domain-containing protein